MSIIILDDPPKDVRPSGAIRADVAWKLFVPEFMGDLPPIRGQGIQSLRNWFWRELSRKCGFLRQNKPEKVYVLAPKLSEAGSEFMIRTCSLWDNEIHVVTAVAGKFDPSALGDNLWMPPMVNLNRTPEVNSAVGKTHATSDEGVNTFYSHVLGATRSFIRTYEIGKGNTYARFHSHTTREELYLVLKGKGTARIADHSVEIVEGDLISKPTGPDIPTQFLADRGEVLKILDIEIWPDIDRNTKDLVHYPDHAELDVFGEGIDVMIPYDSVRNFQDAMENYDKGYRRKADGTWEPKEVPGFKTREK